MAAGHRLLIGEIGRWSSAVSGLDVIEPIPEDKP